MIAWLYDIRIVIAATLNSLAPVDTIIIHVCSPYKSNFSFKLKFEIQSQVRNTEYERIAYILKVVYDLKS